MTFEDLVWSAKWFRIHAAKWREIGFKMLGGAKQGAEADVRPMAFAWPHYADMQRAYTSVSQFYLGEFLPGGPKAAFQIADTLDKNLHDYLVQEAQGSQDIYDAVMKELDR